MSQVVVAGGGLIGLATAWRCAQAGLSVTVIGEAPGRGASLAAAGMLAPVAEVTYGEVPLLSLCRASLERYPAFVAELESASGLGVGLRTTGTMVVGFDADDIRALDELHAYQRGLGLRVERLTPGQARDREPALTPRLRGALVAESDHSVDARALHAALLIAVEAAGVRLVRSRIERLRIEEGAATGVRLAEGTEIDADTVVVALGASSAALPGLPPLDVRPVKGQILRLAGAAGLVTRTIRGLVRGRQVYLVPYGDDRLVVGATVEDRGFDDTVTAGAVHDLLHDAAEVVPEVTELELVETLARWRPGTPDNAPLIGPTGTPGLVLATGHYRNGVLLAPVTGEAVAALLTSGRLPEVALGFTPDRFATSRSAPDGGYAAGLHHLSERGG